MKNIVKRHTAQKLKEIKNIAKINVQNNIITQI